MQSTPCAHWSSKSHIYTTLNSQCVMRWCLFLEECNPIFHYIKGTENSLADALSRLPCSAWQSAPGPCVRLNRLVIQTDHHTWLWGREQHVHCYSLLHPCGRPRHAWMFLKLSSSRRTASICFELWIYSPRSRSRRRINQKPCKQTNPIWSLSNGC